MSTLEIKLNALPATEPGIDCAVMIGLNFRAYGGIKLKIDSVQIKLIILAS